jgi:hypothetical protein
LYVTATVLVYLDVILLPPNRVTAVFNWIAIGTSGNRDRDSIAPLQRSPISGDTPRFDRPVHGAGRAEHPRARFHLPDGAALGIAKLLVLFYSIEMLVSPGRNPGVVWVRVGAAAVLAGLMVRSTLSL